jgi:lincosamide nucleotidyltransferase B/F
MCPPSAFRGTRRCTGGQDACQVLEQDRLIERVRHQCAEDTRLEAALMYGSFTQGQADEWSDIEFWLFFADDSLSDVDPDSWCAGVGPTLLTVQNEFGTHVAIFESLIRGEFHFVPASAVDAVAEWPARGAPVERMLVTDRSGRLRRVLEKLPGTRHPPRSAAMVEQLCGRFVNWLLLGDSVLRRGETVRAHAVLAEVHRHLLWLARLIGQREFRPTPSRLAERELSAAALERYARTTAPADPSAVATAYHEAWAWGREMWLSLPEARNAPTALLAAIDARMAQPP